MSGVLVEESCTTCCISRTGGSTNLDPRLLVMNDVAQKDTLSGRRERMINIFWSSLHALSHSPETDNRLLYCVSFRKDILLISALLYCTVETQKTKHPEDQNPQKTEHSNWSQFFFFFFFAFKFPSLKSPQKTKHLRKPNFSSGPRGIRYFEFRL